MQRCHTFWRKEIGRVDGCSEVLDYQMSSSESETSESDKEATRRVAGNGNEGFGGAGFVFGVRGSREPNTKH